MQSYCAFLELAGSKIQSLTNKFVFHYCQSHVRWLLPASDNCRALFCCLKCAQRLDYSALGSSQRLGGEPLNIWLMVVKNTFVGWALNFSIRMLLKGVVIICCVSTWRLHSTVYDKETNSFRTVIPKESLFGIWFNVCTFELHIPVNKICIYNETLIKNWVKLLFLESARANNGVKLLLLTAIDVFLTFSEANKKLHDTNDDLRSALEVKY